MGLYISNQDVEVRLIGKVRFTDDLEDENRFPRPLLNRLIDEGEGRVEMDLSPRYATPFVTVDDKPFKGYIPARPTGNIIRTLCEIQAVVLILETDFGRGTVVEADKYAEAFRKRYKAMIDDLLAKKGFQGTENGGLGWAKPPLPGLRLAWFNENADDGFQGMVLTTSNNQGGYPAQQINNPADSFWNVFGSWTTW